MARRHGRVHAYSAFRLSSCASCDVSKSIRAKQTPHGQVPPANKIPLRRTPPEQTNVSVFDWLASLPRTVATHQHTRSLKRHYLTVLQCVTNYTFIEYNVHGTKRRKYRRCLLCRLNAGNVCVYLQFIDIHYNCNFISNSFNKYLTAVMYKESVIKHPCASAVQQT